MELIQRFCNRQNSRTDEAKVKSTPTNQNTSLKIGQKSDKSCLRESAARARRATAAPVTRRADSLVQMRNVRAGGGGEARDFPTQTPPCVPSARKKGSWRSDRRRREKSAHASGLTGRGILGKATCRQLCRTVWASAAAKSLFHVKNYLAILAVFTP